MKARSSLPTNPVSNALLAWFFVFTIALSALEAKGSGLYGSGPGGPILVVTNGTNPFSTYYAEILLNEGLNEFALTNVSSIAPAVLSNYDVVILGETALTAGQVTTLSNWVSGGGNLIAMKPDSQLTNLLGITVAGSTLSEGYLLVNTASGPGAGIVGETIQFHGTADRYTLNGASSLATLCSNASTATPNPAVTLRSVGVNGGQAAAFTFDLARSIVLTRQGNPAWVNQDRDNNAPVRPNDLFFGAKAGDMQPDWVNMNKVAIPQADEQQRLLANMIISMNSDRKLLPRFWYFPNGHQAVVVMTADNHGSGDAAARFDQQLAASPAGGSVNDWETIRSTAYLFLGEDLTKTGKSADEYNTNGFEIGLHINTLCANYTSESLEAYFTNQLGQFSQLYPNLPPPTTHRLHCIAWSDYTTLPQMESKYGIRLDANYYYYPQAWVNNRPGMFTGSGMAMRFAKTTGEVIDVYQAATQMTDESGQSYPYTIDTLLDRALGPEGYYGAFVANMHTDADATHPSSVWSSNIVNSAIARGVPVISARQMLTWLDARNQSSISSLNWSNDLLTFSVAAGSNARGLQAIVPILAGDTVSEVRRGVELVTYSLKWIKGVHYAAFPALTGNYTITYADDTTPPTVASVNPTNETVGVSLGTRVTVTFSEAMDPVTITNGITLSNSSGGLVASTVAYNASAFSATLTPNSPLALSTVYTVVVANGANGVKDVAGNALTSVFTASFTMANPAGFTIWDDSTVPAVLIQYDPNEVELGVKFQSALDGYVTGIRFYKGPANVGTHVGNLWTSAGTLLGSVTFVNETSSGWQYQALTNPVPISSNTTYVVSYHAPAGGYSVDPNYFGASGVARYPLRALAEGEDGGNGVYAYGASAFPAQTYNANNYWVDVVVKAPVKIASGVVAESKVYSGTALATLHTNGPVLLSGVLGSDSVSLLTNGYVASFASLHVSNTIPVTVNGLHLGGRDAGNYLLVQPTILAADITPATLTVSGLAAQNKTYDGMTTATLNTGGATLVGVVSGDLVTLSTPAATGAFADPGVGNDKLITVNGLTISGDDAPNYSLAQPTATASITPATVTPSVAVTDKPYDGTTAAAITDRSLSGIIGSDDVNLGASGSAAFVDKNVGTGKIVNITDLGLSGSAVLNYALATTTASTTADITARALVVSAAGSNKVYDGTINATVALSDDRVSGDVFSTSYTTAHFNDRNVGTGKVVSVSGISISGLDAVNYAANPTTSTTADITPALLTVTADNQGRLYGATNPVFTSSSSGFVNGETASVLNGEPSLTTLAVESSPVGVYPIAAAVGTLSATNYAFSFVDGTLTISRATLTVTADNQSRVYGATNPVFTASYSGFVNGDMANVNGGMGGILSGAPSLTTVATENSAVGGYPITAAVGTLSATNYAFSFVDGTLTITPADSATALVSSQNPSGHGSNVTFTTTVTPVAPVSAPPTGGVQFYTNGVPSGSPVVLSGGVASYSTADLPAGTNTVKAVYLGDGNFNGSTNDLAQVVTSNVETPSTLNIQDSGEGTVTITFAGTPGAEYLVQATSDLGGSSWQNVSTNTAAANGEWTLTDSTVSRPVRFYRSAKP